LSHADPKEQIAQIAAFGYSPVGLASFTPATQAAIGPQHPRQPVELARRRHAQLRHIDARQCDLGNFTQR
jgi:hypothetical protein